MKYIKLFEGFINDIEINESKIDAIKKIQSKLIELKFLDLKSPSGRDNIDGIVGKITRQAVKDFQKAKGLKEDGIIGEKTLDKLGMIDLFSELKEDPKKEDDKKEDDKKEPKNEGKSSYLLFNGNKISFIEEEKVVKSWPAISGRSQYQWFITPEIWSRRYKRTPVEWSKVKYEGPTPEGKYRLGPEQYKPGTNWLKKENILLLLAKQNAETNSKKFESKYGTQSHEFSENTDMARFAWGNYRYALYPLKGTNTYGRGSMYLHGGSVPGSIGCIDLCFSINDFAEYFKEWKKKTGKDSIDLIVNYKTFDPNISINNPSQSYKLDDKALKDHKLWTSTVKKLTQEILAKNNLDIPKDIAMGSGTPPDIDMESEENKINIA